MCLSILGTLSFFFDPRFGIIMVLISSSHTAKIDLLFVFRHARPKTEVCFSAGKQKRCYLCHSFYHRPLSVQVTLLWGHKAGIVAVWPHPLQSSKNFLSVYMTPLAGQCFLSAAHPVLPTREHWQTCSSFPIPMIIQWNTVLQRISLMYSN